MPRQNYFVQTIPCPQCNRNIWISISPYTPNDDGILRIDADCQCGFSRQKNFHKDEPWTPASMVRQLIHTTRQIAKGLDEDHLTLLPPNYKHSSKPKPPALDPVEDPPETPQKQTEEPPKKTSEPAPDNPAP